MYSPTRFARAQGDGVSNSLKKSVAQRRSAIRCSGDSDSDGSQEDGLERDSLRLQRVQAKESRDGVSERGCAPRGFRVFPEQPSSPLRAKRRVDIARPTEGITGLCVPGSVPPKVVSIQDYSFSSSSISVFAGQSVLFLLSAAVPEHVEHVLEGLCDDNSELCFVSPILQRQENVSFEFIPLYVGHVRVSCQVYPEMECEVSIISPSSFRRVSSALSAAASAYSPTARATPPMLGIYQSAGVGSIKRSNADSISETMTQSSFFDSDDEFSDQHSLHSTPRRSKAPVVAGAASAVSPSALDTGIPEDDSGHLLLARDLYKHHTAHDRSRIDDGDISFKVSVEDFVFRPDVVMVEQGAKIQFTYHGSVSVQKLSCDGEFENVGLGGDTAPIYVHQFDTAGDFAVVNEVFSFMSCQVTVTCREKDKLSSRITAVGNEQNSQNSNNRNNSIHPEQSLDNFIDSKVLRSKLLKNRGIALKVSTDVAEEGSSNDSGDDGGDETFDSGAVKSVIDRQLSLCRLKKNSLKMFAQDEGQQSSVSSMPTVLPSEGDGMTAGPAESPGRSALRLCGSFPLSATASKDAASYEALNPEHNLSVQLPTTASKRRHRRKQMQTLVLSAVGIGDRFGDNSDHDVDLRGGGASDGRVPYSRLGPSSSGRRTINNTNDDMTCAKGSAQKSIDDNDCAKDEYLNHDPVEVDNRKNCRNGPVESLGLGNSCEDLNFNNEKLCLISLESVQLSGVPSSPTKKCTQMKMLCEVVGVPNSEIKRSNVDNTSQAMNDNLMDMLTKASKSRSSKKAVPPPPLRSSPHVPEVDESLLRDVEDFFMKRWFAVEASIDSNVDKEMVEKTPAVCRYEVKSKYHESRHRHAKWRGTDATRVRAGDVPSAKRDSFGSRGKAGGNGKYMVWRRHQDV